MKNILLIITALMMNSCFQNHPEEFIQLQRKLSHHFAYRVLSSDIKYDLNCKKVIFDIEGKAKKNLRLRSNDNVFLNLPMDKPSALDEVGLSRIKDRMIHQMKTSGIKEHCLEVRDFECIRYHFRDFTEQDLTHLVQEIDNEYYINLKQGEEVVNKIQLRLCPQQEAEVSYLVQVP